MSKKQNDAKCCLVLHRVGVHGVSFERAYFWAFFVDQDGGVRDVVCSVDSVSIIIAHMKCYTASNDTHGPFARDVRFSKAPQTPSKP